MNRLTRLAIALLLLPLSAIANPVLTEDTVRGISAEVAQAMRDKDMSVIEKYMHPDSRIVIDLDPDLNAGQQEIRYEEFMMLSQMSMQAIEDIEVHDEVLSVSIDEANNQATIEEKTTATVTMMGMKMKDVSLTKTTYGVIDGQIKVLSTEDQLISSGPVQ